MHVPLNISVFFLLVFTKAAAIKADNECVVEKKIQDFISDQNKDTREGVKTDMNVFFEEMSESIQQKLKTILSEVDKSIVTMSVSVNQRITANEAKLEKSFVDLSDSLHKKLAMTDLKIEQSMNTSEVTKKSIVTMSASVNQRITANEAKLEKSFMDLSDSLHKKLAMTDLKIEQSMNSSEVTKKSIVTMSASVNQRIKAVEDKLVDLSDSIDKKLAKTDLKIEQSNAILSESFNASQAELFLKLRNQTDVINDNRQILRSLSPGVTTVKELVADSGTIEFVGEEDSNIKHKIWMIQAVGKEYINVNFELEENNLGSKAFLALLDADGGYYSYNGLQAEWKMQRRFGEVELFVVALTIRDSLYATKSLSFKLRYNVTRHNDPQNVLPTEVLRKDGIQFVSYPLLNKQNYPINSEFHAVIAPSSAKSFKLTLKYLDVPGTHPDCSGTYLKVYFLKDSPSGTRFERQSLSVFSHCGRLGNISQEIGKSTVAVLSFRSDSPTETGRGFLLEVDNSS